MFTCLYYTNLYMFTCLYYTNLYMFTGLYYTNLYMFIGLYYTNLYMFTGLYYTNLYMFTELYYTNLYMFTGLYYTNLYIFTGLHIIYFNPYLYFDTVKRMCMVHVVIYSCAPGICSPTPRACPHSALIPMVSSLQSSHQRAHTHQSIFRVTTRASYIFLRWVLHKKPKNDSYKSPKTPNYPVCMEHCDRI